MSDHKNNPQSDPSEEDLARWIPQEEQRDEFRITGRVAVSVEVEAGDEGRQARIVKGYSRDISASGVSLNAPEALPVGALLPVTLCIEANSCFELMAEVRWCIPRPSHPGFRVGLVILVSDETAFLEWKEAIAQLLTMD